MKLKTTPFDAAEYLETDEDIRVFLQAAIDEGPPEYFPRALATAARAKGMTEIAKQAGVSRSSLYKSLAEGANPRFETISRVCAALGLRLTVIPERATA